MSHFSVFTLDCLGKDICILKLALSPHQSAGRIFLLFEFDSDHSVCLKILDRCPCSCFIKWKFAKTRDAQQCYRLSVCMTFIYHLQDAEKPKGTDRNMKFMLPNVPCKIKSFFSDPTSCQPP